MPSGCDSIATLDLRVVAEVIPTFAPIGPFCLNSTAPNLPPASLEGINGIWSPSTINTSVIGTSSYLFTPTTGQCVSPAQIDIAVSNSPTATASGGTFCNSGTTTLAITGTTGGTFSATPAGLVIDPATGVIDLGASTPNTYDITYSFGTAPCTGTATSQVTVSAQPTATVSGGTFCNSGTTTLAVTGTTGGTFSALPAGLVIDPATGVIDLGASTPNTYDITYSFGTAPCTGTATSQVTISNIPTATVSGGAFCATGTTTLTTTGATGGTFSATPAGLVIDPATGVIDLAASTPNTYDITYSFGTAPCTGTATSQVTVSAQPTATVSGGTFCNSGTTTLAVTGTTGGTFSALPAGLVIDPATGVIDLGASTPNTYDITYSFGTAPCTGTATSQVTISNNPTATVSGGAFCATGTTTLTTTGATGGTFSATPAGLVIDPATGAIDLGASTPNTYDITYSFGTAPCTGTATSQVTVSAQPAATVSGGTFCNSGTTTLAVTGTTGGTFSALPGGLVIDPATGVIDLGASTPNTYDITYSFGTAPCTGTATSQVTVSNNPTATVTGGTFCTTGTTTLTTTGATGGTFSATPAGLVIDATTGQIDLAASAPNTYTITYSFGTVPCTGTATSQVTVSAQPAATVSGGTFCNSGTTTLTVTGTTGGTFSATPAGLVIDPATGVIDLGASTPNTYDITYSFGTAPCTGTATSQVTISNNPTATVSGGAFCASGTTTLTTTGATGGTFSATPAGLVIDPATGVIDLAASTPNTYDITYSFGTAPCTGTATSQVTVSAQPTATVSGGTFCNSGTTTLAVTGTTGGTFSALPAGLVIDPATGVIDLGASTPNTYDITYSFGTAPCTGTATSQVTISNNPTATVSGGTFCTTGTTTLTTTGATGGTFSATPAGLVIDPATGVIDLAASTPNTYDITYSFGTAPCTGTATSQVTVSAQPTATVRGGTFCNSGTTTLTVTGTTGGTFSATPAGLVIDPVQG
jgi:hypothetical protein